ncbi:MAG TPA: hypothetical protein VE093_36940 [Polyangiaceae bacterium]|nr:hypothetical protein [Polyangiaceae bacterium]
MKAEPSKKTRVFGLVLLPLLALVGQAGGCIIVADEVHVCYEGEVACQGDYVVQCFDNTWVEVDDCWSACGGTCGILEDGAHEEVVCICPL